MNTVPRVTVTEVRVLEGPNLYFARPAIKIIVDCPGTRVRTSGRCERSARVWGCGVCVPALPTPNSASVRS